MRFPRDKVLHFFGGAAFAGVVFLLAVAVFRLIGFCTVPPYVAVAIATAASTFLGWAKEYLYDAKKPERHTVDKLDWYATAAGGVVGALGAYLGYLWHLAAS